MELWPLIQEYNPCTIDYVSLHVSYIKNVPNVWNPDDVMVWWPPYLKDPIIKNLNAIN